MNERRSHGQSIGTAVRHQMNDAPTGDITTKMALENSQWVTGRVIKQMHLIENQHGNPSIN